MKLTNPQARVLARICATNGGGISEMRFYGPERKPFLRLIEMGLIQGKLGNASNAVHTAEGWAINKQLQTTE
jgi:hypothetical protein